jgi:enoyl-CoA hydratase/carnithine racemase
MFKTPVASRYAWQLQQLACYRKFATLTPAQASIDPHPEVQGVYTLTLNRPETKNSLGHQLMKQLRDSLQAFKHQQARCLLINSAVQGTFCAGADLKVYLLRNRLLLLFSQTHQRELISAKSSLLILHV